MSKSNLTKALATITKKLKWVDNKDVGYTRPISKDRYFNPLLTPPPRSPSTPEDFMNHKRLGHWYPLGINYESPVADKYIYHELVGSFVFCSVMWIWLFTWGPDLKERDWSKREAFLRTHKREALGLPLIDKNVVDPDRIVLPTEEELVGFEDWVSF